MEEKLNQSRKRELGFKVFYIKSLAFDKLKDFLFITIN